MKSEILLAELHVERADRLRLIINMKTALPTGRDLPPALVARVVA